jgi:hypothetical protein
MYIPKNRIITNLEATTAEFVYKDTLEPYRGSYWKTFEGKFFTGKGPNDTPYYEIVLIENVEDTFSDTLPQSQFAVIDAPTPFQNVDDGPYQEEMLIKYAELKNLDLTKSNRKYLPYISYPQPTIDDYELGTFTRYFLTKTNEISYMEVSKEIFDNINKQNPEWEWELYIPFSFPWSLTGDESEVKQTNRNIVLLQEQRLKKAGLGNYLKHNYSKFYIS